MIIENFGDIIKYEKNESKRLNELSHSILDNLRYDYAEFQNLRGKIQSIDNQLEYLVEPKKSPDIFFTDLNYEEGLKRYLARRDELLSKKKDLMKRYNELLDFRREEESKTKPLWNKVRKNIYVMFNERLNQLRQGEFNDSDLERARREIYNKTKISEFDVPNVLLSLEAIMWTNNYYLGTPKKQKKEVYLFGSALKNPFYRKVGLLSGSEDARDGLKKLSEYNSKIKFDKLFESYDFGLGGFSYRDFFGKYKLIMPEGSWKNFGKTIINLVVPKNEISKLPEDFKKIKLI